MWGIIFGDEKHIISVGFGWLNQRHPTFVLAERPLSDIILAVVIGIRNEWSKAPQQSQQEQEQEQEKQNQHDGNGTAGDYGSQAVSMTTSGHDSSLL